MKTFAYILCKVIWVYLKIDFLQWVINYTLEIWDYQIAFQKGCIFTPRPNIWEFFHFIHWQQALPIFSIFARVIGKNYYFDSIFIYLCMKWTSLCIFVCQCISFSCELPFHVLCTSVYCLYLKLGLPFLLSYGVR